MKLNEKDTERINWTNSHALLGSIKKTQQNRICGYEMKIMVMVMMIISMNVEKIKNVKKNI